MKNTLLLLSFFLLFLTSGFTQSNCNQLKIGIDYYNSNNFYEAINSFVEIWKSSEKGEECYIESSLWIAKSNYKIDINSSMGSEYLAKSLSYNNIESLRYYALQYPFYDKSLSEYINLNSYLKKYDDGEVYFLMGNIYAKITAVDEDYIFNDYLSKSIEKGFNGDALYSENFIIELNEKRYHELVTTFELYVKMYVEERINRWQKKGKFEKTATYVKRVNKESRLLKINELTQIYLDSIGSQKINFSQAINEYDADNEIFKITFKNLNSIYLPIPLNEAKSFDRNFKSIVYEDPNFTYYNRKLELLHLEAINLENKKRYIYDSKEMMAFNSSALSFNFEKVDITLSGKQSENNIVESINEIKVGKSDVDVNIPVNKIKLATRYALVIGNEDYTQYQGGLSSESNVDFAKADAISFSKYCVNTLGVPKENIILLIDAISSQMRREIEKLMKLAMYSDGEAEIIFYYAGHGFPDEQSKESYLMPVDISGAEVTSGIKLADLYSKLTKYPTKKVTVFLDACFSGSGRNQGLLAARGVKIAPKENLIQGNLIIFSASSGAQSSLPYTQKQHGMFTYYLLKKLQESRGNINYGELSDYIVKQVQLNSIKVNSKDQNPQVLFSREIESIWRNWKFD